MTRSALGEVRPRSESLDELRSAVQRDPRRVADVAITHVAAARAGGDQARLSRALGILGRARRALGDIALAESDLLDAVAAGQRAGDDELAADAYVGLAGVLVFAGRSVEALDHLATAERLGSERVRAYAALQRAFVARKTGRTPDALAAFEAALPTLRRIEAWTDVALVLLNRGVIHTESGRFDEALVDFSEAGELFAAEKSDYGVAQVRHGIGWTHARRGDLVRGLDHLDRAAALFDELGYQGREVDVDRVETLLAAGLASAGAELGAATARRAAAAGDRSSEAQMWLMCARAAFLDGDRIGGAALAERARRLFAEQATRTWAHIARLEAVRGGAADAGADELIAIAADLDRAGHARGAATAVALAALTACRTGAIEHASGLARDCARRARRLGVFEIRVLAEHAEAVCAVARADRTAARRHVRAGLAELRRHRSTFAAADARASVSIHSEDLTRLGLRLALAGGRPTEVLELVELGRSGRRREPSARPLGDPDAAAELSELRAVTAAVRHGELAGDDTVDLLHRQRDLEHAAHRRWLRTAAGETDAENARFSTTDFASALGDARLVELVQVDDELVAVTMGAMGRARLHRLGPAGRAYRATDVLATSLRDLVLPQQTPARRQAAGDRLHRAAAELDRVLHEALRGDRPVVLVVPPAMHAVPWQLVRALSGRPIVVPPSATWWAGTQWEGTRWDGTATARPEGGPEPVVAVAGPRLTEADAEAKAVARCYSSATVLTGPSATTNAVGMALARATTAHVASHGLVRRDNPLWSSLELADGPLCVYDLALLPRTPRTVVLSGCETGVGVQAGDGLLGLSTALLDQGTQSLVASVCMLPDSEGTRLTMTALHEQLAAGRDPSVALAMLAAGAGAVAADDPAQNHAPAAAMLAASLTCFGAR